jgi:hypothetical protein
VSDKAWKQFERDVGVLIDGKRFPANLGESVDVEGQELLAQCKLVSRLSLAELTKLAEIASQDGRLRGKVGIAAVKLKAGKGHPTPGLVVMTFDEFRHLVVLRESGKTDVRHDGLA